MSTLKSIIFQVPSEDSAEEYWETVEALKDLDRQYQHFTRTVWKASKQLLKFDEINRLVAYEVEEKAPKTSTARASSGSSRSSSSSGSKTPSATTPKTATGTAASARWPGTDATLPLYFTIKDVLFNWGDLNWEAIMMKLVAGLSALGGGFAGAMVGGASFGPFGLVLGLGLGLVFGCLLDETIFNFDGVLDRDELIHSLLAILPAFAGAAVGFFAAGPTGAAIGILVGSVISMKLLGIDADEVYLRIVEFFQDLQDNWQRRWQGFNDLVRGLWSDLKSWWHGLSLDRFTFRLPHLTVTWQELNSDSILARYLGITAIPHMGVEWYARGGIVDGATLIGAGEQGKEAIVPLERHTEWIRLVAVQLKEELTQLFPASTRGDSESLGQLLRMIPASASSLVPYGATVPMVNVEAPDLSALADTLARAIEAMGQREDRAQEIRVYLDGRQLSDAVSRYQRRTERAIG